MKHYKTAQRGMHELAVINSAGVGTRLLGIPFLVAGLYLFWGAYLVVASHARAGSLGTVSGWLPIVAFLLIFGAIFSWPGVAMSLTVRTVSLITNPRKVVEVVWRGPVRRQRTFELTNRARIILQQVVKSSPTGPSAKNAIAQRRNFFMVNVGEQVTDKGAPNVCRVPTLTEAQELATALSLFSGLPIIDATKPPSERDEDADADSNG